MTETRKEPIYINVRYKKRTGDGVVPGESGKVGPLQNHQIAYRLLMAKLQDPDVFDAEIEGEVVPATELSFPPEGPPEEE